MDIWGRSVAIIPCFNTSSICADVIRRTMRHVPYVLAVDDGSTDDTYEYINSTGCKVLRLEVNVGKGRALRAGILEVLKGREGILRAQFDRIITLDGDGQHDPEEIPTLITAMLEGNYELVVGVRNLKLMPLKSKVGNYFSRLFFLLGLGSYLADTQSGFRVLTVGLAKSLIDKVTWGRYESEMDTLCKAASLGYSIGSVEIRTIYFDKNRKTHFRPLYDSMRVFSILCRYGLVSLSVTGLDLSTFVLMVTGVKAGIGISNLVARVAAVIAHFMMTREYAFRVRGELRGAEIFRYLLVVGANLLFTTWVISSFVTIWRINVIAAKVMAQMAGFGLSFILLKWFVYHDRTQTKTDWEAYYRSPFPLSRFTRKITESQMVDYIKRFSQKESCLAILEIGGGDSCFLVRLFKELDIGTYTIVDNSPDGIRLANEKFSGQYPGKIVFHCEDALSILPSPIFDLVFSVGLLEHFQGGDLRELVAKHRLSVKESGLVILSVPTPTFLYRITRGIAEALGVWRFPDECPIDLADIVELLENNDLIVLDSKILWGLVLTQVMIVARPKGRAKRVNDFGTPAKRT